MGPSVNPINPIVKTMVVNDIRSTSGLKYHKIEPQAIHQHMPIHKSEIPLAQMIQIMTMHESLITYDIKQVFNPRWDQI